MKQKYLSFIILTFISLGIFAQNPHLDFIKKTKKIDSKNFSTWSGTIRLGGGLYGSVYSYVTPVTVGLLRTFTVTDWSKSDFENWSSEQHGILRFINIGGDILIPNWTMSASNADIEIHRPLEDYQTDGFLDGGMRQYTTYIGYYFNWRSSRIGCYFGADYEWRNFLIFYPYPDISYNKIHSLVPSAGLRYQLIDELNEIETFKFNIVLEAGMSFVINTKYDNTDGYGLEALNNGFRSMLGIAITTSRYGSIHVRWTKDLYNLFNNEFKASSGPLLNNEITNSFSCFSIGWAIFI